MIVTESEKALLKFSRRVLLIWTVETIFNAIAASIWAHFSKYNSESIFELFLGTILIYGAVKGIFHLVPYWIFHRYFFPTQPESISFFVSFQVGLFIFISFITGGIFAWNLFYNDVYLAIGMVVSSVVAAFLFAYSEKRQAMSRA